jgi:hypothetical protein
MHLSLFQNDAWLKLCFKSPSQGVNLLTSLWHVSNTVHRTYSINHLLLTSSTPLRVLMNGQKTFLHASSFSGLMADYQKDHNILHCCQHYYLPPNIQTIICVNSASLFWTISIKSFIYYYTWEFPVKCETMKVNTLRVLSQEPVIKQE